VALGVAYTLAASTQISQYKAEALAHPSKYQAALYEAIKKAITDIVASEDLAFHRQFALGGDLAGIRRVKVMKRFRVFFIASSSKKAARVLLIGFRKAGDKNDAYKDLGRRLINGEFDHAFAEIGMTKPSG